jgi:hypothetical protein
MCLPTKAQRQHAAQASQAALVTAQQNMQAHLGIAGDLLQLLRLGPLVCQGLLQQLQLLCHQCLLLLPRLRLLVRRP